MSKAFALPHPPQNKPFYTVVLDPGHGGQDSGSIGYLRQNQTKTAVKEKDITLHIALQLGAVLKNPSYAKILGRPIKVIYTRKRDEDLELKKRSLLARKKKADLFVSIHANAEHSGQAEGIETYFLNNTDDESSNKLAEIENKSAKKEIENSAVSLLLRSVTADALVLPSQDAASFIQESIATQFQRKKIPIYNRGVKQGMFYVLLDAQVPAVLVEAPFLTHQKDLELLNQNSVRAEIAEGMAKGIVRYLAVK